MNTWWGEGEWNPLYSFLYYCMFEISRNRTFIKKREGGGLFLPSPSQKPSGAHGQLQSKRQDQRRAGVEWGSKGNRAILRPGAVGRDLPGCGAGPSCTRHTPGQASGAGRPGPGSASQLLPHPPTHSSWVFPAVAPAPALPGPSWGVRGLPKAV